MATPPVVLGEAEGTKPANPYIALIETISNAQEKDNRAIREMLENRTARLAIIRSMQTSEANTVATFEKFVRQMKEDSANLAPVPTQTASDLNPSAPTGLLPTPPVPTTPVVATPVKGGVVPASPSEMQKLVQELEQLSQKVKDLSGQLSPPGNN